MAGSAFVLSAVAAALAEARALAGAVVIVPPVVVPPAVAQGINLQPFVAGANGTDVLAFWRWCTFERYDRHQVLSTHAATGGSLRMIAVTHYSGQPLQLNGVTVNATMVAIDSITGARGALVVLPPTVANGSQVDIQTPNLAQGWYRCAAVAGAWQIPAWYVYVPGPGPLPKVAPVVRANWEFNHPSDGRYVAADTVVPALFNPLAVPYPPRTFPDMSTVPTRAACVETHIVVARSPDVYRSAGVSSTARAPEGGGYSPREPGVSGLVTTFNRQPYDYFDEIGLDSALHALLDGPRGVGTVFGAQHLAVGRNRKILFTDNWRFGRIVMSEGGRVQTLIGEYDEVPTLWTDRPKVQRKLAGIWDGVQGARSINECWGIAWWVATTATDTAAAPQGGEQPHIDIGPLAHLPDRNHNRILRGQFNGGGDKALALFGNRDHDAPAIVSEWLTLIEPWECVTDLGNQLITSERGKNRIVFHDMRDRTLLQSFNVNGYPEGLFYQDDVLTYAVVQTNAGGSITGGEIRTRSAGGADAPFITLTAPWIIDNNSRFAKITRSDGTFGPRGMLLLATWSGNGYGYPLMFTPDGKKVSDSVFPGDPTGGPGLPWKRGSFYPTACAAANGIGVFSTMNEGIRIVSKALPTDTNLATPGYLAGAADYRARFLNGRYGDDGYTLTGERCPPGISANIDEYLRANGTLQ